QRAIDKRGCSDWCSHQCSCGSNHYFESISIETGYSIVVRVLCGDRTNAEGGTCGLRTADRAECKMIQRSRRDIERCARRTGQATTAGAQCVTGAGLVDG